MVSTDLPTPEEFEEAQEAIENDDPELAPHFDYWHRVDDFNDYSAFMAYVAAEKAERSARSASAAKSSLNNYENAAKAILMGIGIGVVVEAVVGDARF